MYQKAKRCYGRESQTRKRLCWRAFSIRFSDLRSFGSYLITSGVSFKNGDVSSDSDMNLNLGGGLTVDGNVLSGGKERYPSQRPARSLTGQSRRQETSPVITAEAPITTTYSQTENSFWVLIKYMAMSTETKRCTSMLRAVTYKVM